jgi:hypothetical protein
MIAVATFWIPPSTMKTPAWIAMARAVTRKDARSHTPNASRLSRLSTRKGAVRMGGRPGNRVTLDADAQGTGLREWFASVGELSRTAAAFDTRLEGLAAFTGQASHAISRQLRSHGFVVIARPQSFLVTGSNQLRPGEEDRARRWGEQLAGKLAAAPTRAGHS